MEFNLQYRSITDDMLKKRWLRMKITGLFLFIALLPISANTLSQTINFDQEFNGNNLEEFMTFVETQSGYKFFLSNSEIDTKQQVDKHIGKTSINNAVDKVFNKLGIDYKITDDKSILVISKNADISKGVQINTRTVSGIIKDDTGATVPGVSVSIKGTTRGSITDINGKYTLTNVKSTDILVFSFVGMKTQEITVGNQTAIGVTMKANAIGLDEVVAIGYGTTTKRAAVGAISTIKADKIENTPHMNVGGALQGQVPGLIVQNSGGKPGSNPSISIRGGKEPLYVIDGVITVPEDFQALNPSDIETVNFLKDATATAVYGSQGADGIILVTTKKGEKGKMSVNYSYQYELSQPTTMPDQMNSYENASLLNKAYNNAGLGDYHNYSKKEMDIIKNHTDLANYPDNDWPSMTLKTFAPKQSHNLSLRGGDKRTKYFVSMGYVDQGGLLKANTVNYSRFNIRSNVSTKFDKIGLTVGVNVNASLDHYKEPPAGMSEIWRSINQRTSPLYSAYNKNGDLEAGFVANPLAITSSAAGYNKTRNKFINTQLRADWKLPWVKGLRVGIMGNYRAADGWNKKWDKVVPLYQANGSLKKQNPPSLSMKSSNSHRTYLESSINYARTFGKHGIEGTFVYNRIQTGSENLSGSRKNYLSRAVDQLFAGSKDGMDTSGNQQEGASSGYVFRLKYNYDYKYILEFSGRYDGNDNFSKGNKWGFFPAVSGAWNVMGENFMKSIKDKNILSQLKLRVGYGKVGSVSGVNRFGYMSVYNMNSETLDIGGSLVNGFSEGNLTDPSQFTWYETSSLNYGLDFACFDNKLSGTFEYFYYRTTNFLTSPKSTYTEPLGKSLPQINSNSAKRRAGYEVSLNYRGNINKLKYSIGGNFSSYNELWETNDNESSTTLLDPNSRLTHRTKYWAMGKVYQTDGYYQNSKEIINNPRPTFESSIMNGDIKKIDENGDGKIDGQDTRFVNKPTTPLFTYGLNFSLDYKGWYMNGLFQGTGNRYVSFDRWMISEAQWSTYKYQLDRWSPTNRNALYPRIKNTSGGNDWRIANHHYLHNAKYFRLKNLQIGYDLKKSVLAKTRWLSSCKVFANGTNLLTWSPVKKFFDPEQVMNKGVAVYGYPVQRTFSFGINVGF